VSGIFFEITIIICLASFLSIVFRLFKQPAIFAYILAGIIIGPFGQLQLHNANVLGAMGEFGITLLLFSLGLELKLKDLRSIGASAVIIGFAQILITSILGYEVARLLGFSSLISFYIAASITFSSTIIIVKLLSDKKDISSLYGKLSVGTLIIQDLVAIFILMLLSLFHKGIAPSTVDILLVFAKGSLLFLFTIFVSGNILPKITSKIASSQETLFLFSLAWVFGMSTFVTSVANFPIEIGGFLAGLALANSTENWQIIARVRALRDFFITIFFVVIGMGLSFANIQGIIYPLVSILLFVIIAKPMIMIIIMSFLGYRRRVSFLTGLNMGQISEFSLIIVFAANRVGHIGGDVVSLVTMVGLISFIISTYIITKSNPLYNLLGRFLTPLERINTKGKGEQTINEDLSKLTDHVVLIGVHRVGKSILEALEEEGKKVVVVDFDPDVIRDLKSEILSVFGDIADTDIQERVGLKRAKVIISTVPDIEDNLLLLQSLSHTKNDIKVVVVAYSLDEARELYKNGAHYVVLPHLAGGRHIAKLIKDNNLGSLEALKAKDLKYLG